MTLDRHEIKVLKDKKRFGLKDEYCIFSKYQCFFCSWVSGTTIGDKTFGEPPPSFLFVTFFLNWYLSFLLQLLFFFFSRVYEKMNFDLGFNLFIEVILLLSTIMELNPIKWFSILHFMFDLWIYEYIFLGIIIQSELLFFLLLNCYIQISFFVITIIVNKFSFMRIIFKY